MIQICVFAKSGDTYGRPRRLRDPGGVLISPLTVNSWSRLQPVVIQTQHTPHYCSSKSRPITRKMAVISRTLHPNKPLPAQFSQARQLMLHYRLFRHSGFMSNLPLHLLRYRFVYGQRHQERISLDSLPVILVPRSTDRPS